MRCSAQLIQLELQSKLIDWAYQIFINELQDSLSHVVYNTREICASELKIWECKQKIFSENAAWNWITAHKDRLDWNLKQRDKTWWETEQTEDFSIKVWHKIK